jgi:hypothetical protein
VDEDMTQATPKPDTPNGADALREQILAIAKRRQPFINERGNIEEYSFEIDDLVELINQHEQRLLASLLEHAEPMRGGKLGSVVTINQAVPAAVIEARMRELRGEIAEKAV